MKVTEQNIPPELAALYAAVASQMQIDPSGTGTVRTRRAATSTHSKRRHKGGASVFDPIINALMNALGMKMGDEARGLMLQDQRDKIRRGNFDLQYWIPCDQVAEAYLQSTPSWIENTNPPPYAYRDPLNRPSIPTYSDGGATSAPCLYNGQTSGEIYRDTLLRWVRRTHELIRPHSDDPLDHAIIKLAISQQVSASTRGVRTAFSCAVMAWMHNADAPCETTTTPPVQPKFSDNPPADALLWPIVWRYRTPQSEPPYYIATNQWHAVMRAATVSQESVAPGASRVTTLAAPNPAYGLEYNNNEALAISADLTVEVWQLRKFDPVIVMISFYYTNNHSDRDNIYAEKSGYGKTVTSLNYSLAGGVQQTSTRAKLFFRGIEHQIANWQAHYTLATKIGKMTGNVLISNATYSTKNKSLSWEECEADGVERHISQPFPLKIFSVTAVAGESATRKQIGTTYTDTILFNNPIAFKIYNIIGTVEP